MNYYKNNHTVHEVVSDESLDSTSGYKIPPNTISSFIHQHHLKLELKPTIMAPSPLTASPHLHEFLKALHSQSLTQESKLDWASLPQQCTDDFDNIMRDKFIALDQDKCELIYHFLRSINATTVVEAGTSFGVSTIYLALAVSQNVARSNSDIQSGRVIATEKESSKASVAVENWERAGGEIKDVIDLRIGDLRETLVKDLGTVDFLLLDSEY